MGDTDRKYWEDGGRLVVELYGHPDRQTAIERMRRAYGSVEAPKEEPARIGRLDNAV